MPFELVKVDDGWKVKSKPTGRLFSRNPLPLARAKAQMRALYASEKKGGVFEGAGYSMVKHRGKNHTFLDGSGFFSDIFDKAKKVAMKAVNVVKETAQKVYKKAEDKLSVRLDYPPKVREVLKTYGNDIITGIMIRRQPIQTFINKALDLVSGNKFSEAVRKLNYDNLFHLGMIVYLQRGRKYYSVLVEKNEVININPVYSTLPETDYLEVPIGERTMTLNQLLFNAEQAQGKEFFKYHPFTNNCQKFISNILTANGLMNEEVNAFVNQDAQSILAELPEFAGKFAKGITDIAGFANRVIEGDGKLEAKPNHTLNVNGVKLRGMAVRRGGALVFNQQRFNELQGLIPSKEKWEASFKRRGATPNQTYEQYRAQVEDINRKRSMFDDEADARIARAKEEARIHNEEYAQRVAENPDLETVWCKYDANGDEKRNTTTKGECRQNHETHFRKWEEREHPANAKFFRPAVDALAKTAGVLADIVPGVPAPLRQVGKWASEQALQANSIAGQGGAPGDKKGVFRKDLGRFGFDLLDYLRDVRAVAEKKGYKPEDIDIATNGKSKIRVKTPEGKWVNAGRIGYGDYIIWKHLEATGKVEPGTADKRRDAYLARASKIKGNWKKNKFSPNNLAMNLLW